jgi:glyoxylase-like metal-dependent hydrolase (beta-lactamase superfamily II)
MIEVVPLLDAHGSFATLREAFGVDDDTPWELPFHAFLVRGDGWTAIVDTGVGPPGEEPFLPERPGRLPDALVRAGVRREDVDAVVLTHLHVDHVGWNMRDGAPFFPNASYVAPAADYEFFTTARHDRPYVRDNLVALRETGRLELVDGGAEPLPGLELLPAPGHTPGHCIVTAGEFRLLADLAVHELQLERPDLAYAAEEDPAAAAALRRRLFPELAAAGTPVALAHLTPPLGRLETTGDGFAWRPLD